MGNPDIVIIINDGEYTFVIKGTEYDGHWRDKVFGVAIEKYNKWADEIKKFADKPEELQEFFVKKIETYEI